MFKGRIRGCPDTQTGRIPDRHDSSGAVRRRSAAVAERSDPASCSVSLSRRHRGCHCDGRDGFLCVAHSAGNCAHDPAARRRNCNRRNPARSGFRYGPARSHARRRRHRAGSGGRAGLFESEIQKHQLRESATMADEIRVAIASDQDIVLARQRGRTLAFELGFSSSDSTLVATAISELARIIFTDTATAEISPLSLHDALPILIVGIQPEVAFAMVQLGLTLEGVATALDLEEGLAYLIKKGKRTGVRGISGTAPGVTGLRTDLDPRGKG